MQYEIGERIYEEIFAGARPSRWYGFPFVSLRSRVLIGFCVLRVTITRTRPRVELASRSTSTAPVLLNAAPTNGFLNMFHFVQKEMGLMYWTEVAVREDVS